MTASNAIRLGTRSTRLARVQAEEIRRSIAEKSPGTQVEIVEITTSGDESPEQPIAEIGETGVFVRGLEEALQHGEIDIAVHSAKDLPTALAPGLVLGAVTRRLDGSDALITREGLGALSQLPQGARVGTSSPRRQAQLLELRRDLQIIPLRGSVETRLAKLDAGEVDALVLAVAGLRRLGLDGRATCILDENHFISAAGQGALALEARQGEHAELLRALSDPDSKIELDAERAFLKAVEAGCQAPVGVRAWVCVREMLIKGMVASPDGAHVFRSGRVAPKVTATVNGQMLAQSILAMGGKDVLAAWRKG